MRASHVEYHAPARFDDLLEIFVRVERIGTTSVTYDYAAYRCDDDGARRADGDREADARADRPRPTGGRCRSRLVPRRASTEFEAMSAASAARSRRSTGSSTAAATPTTSCARSSTRSSSAAAAPGRGDPLRRGRRARPRPGGRRPRAGRAHRLPVVFERRPRRRARRRRLRRPAFLERVAVLISPYCLVGWDTGGVPWDPCSVTGSDARTRRRRCGSGTAAARRGLRHRASTRASSRSPLALRELRDEADRREPLRELGARVGRSPTGTPLLDRAEERRGRDVRPPRLLVLGRRASPRTAPRAAASIRACTGSVEIADVPHERERAARAEHTRELGQRRLRRRTSGTPGRPSPRRRSRPPSGSTSAVPASTSAAGTSVREHAPASPSSGSTAITRAPVSTSRRVSLPVPAATSATTRPAPRPSRAASHATASSG